MKGRESDDEMMDGSLVFMNVTAWRYVGDDEIRYGRWSLLCNHISLSTCSLLFLSREIVPNTVNY